MEGIVFPQKVGEWGRWDVVAHGWRHSETRGEGGAGGVGLQINADAVGVLGMLQQEPGTGKGLLTGGTYVVGGLVSATCR